MVNFNTDRAAGFGGTPCGGFAESQMHSMSSLSLCGTLIPGSFSSHATPDHFVADVIALPEYPQGHERSQSIGSKNTITTRRYDSQYSRHEAFGQGMTDDRLD